MTYGLDIQTLIDAFPHFVFVLDEDHRIYGANAAMLAYLKSSSNDLNGKCCHTLVHGTQAPICDCPLQKAKATGSFVEQEINDPSIGWVMTGIYPLDATAADGKRLYLHVVRPLD